VLCACGLTMLVIGLTSHGPLPDVAASNIPASVQRSVPRQAAGHAQAMARSAPVLLRVPAIGVQAPVAAVGLNTNGTVQVPPLNDHNLTGWYQYGPAPGQRGPAVLLGHVDSVTGVSVFFHLKNLRKGDRIYLTLADGKTATFAVDGLQRVSKTAFPTAAVYGKLSYPGLRLITCGGTFDPATGHYADNIIVYAHLI